MNKIYITGRITKDIELKGNENKFITNTIAVYIGKDKQENEITNFFDFKAFNYQANKLSKYATKGSKIAIEGVLKQDTWEDETGNHSRYMIYAESIEIIADTKKEEAPQKQEETTIKIDDSESDMPW